MVIPHRYHWPSNSISWLLRSKTDSSRPTALPRKFATEPHFREGNGRTQLTFLSLLADNAGLPFGAEELVKERVLDAMIQSFDGNEQPLADLIMDIISSTQ